ncbi:MAG TPA: DUF5658 family protein [Vicinamibacterales bacterium]|nr:DUF5658 family protein [Vicinamibacterales bacterium]
MRISKKAVWGTVVVVALSAASPAAAQERFAADLRLPVVADAVSQGRSTLLPVLYGTYATLQVLDVTTTVAAIRNGAAEANPAVAPVAGSHARFLAFKAASTALTYGAVRAIEKKNRKAAIATMLALNVATALVVANNARNARR